MDTQVLERDEAADSTVKFMRRSAVSSCYFPLEICCIQGSHVGNLCQPMWNYCTYRVKYRSITVNAPERYSVIFLVTD